MRKYLLTGVVAAIPAFLLGSFTARRPTTTPTQQSSNIPIRQSGYHYINPLLECEGTEGIENNSELSSLKVQLESELDQIKSSGQITNLAIYFRDLNNGPWFGLHEDDDFSPASLLKTPVMIAYLKQAESDPSILTRKLRYDPSVNPPESPAPNIPSMQPKDTYTIEELISRMITYSDNNAFNLLVANISYDAIKQVHTDLGLTLPDDSTPEDFISVKQYAGIFRVLFNSSYLSRSMSERALSILSQASYHDGLVAGVDKEIEIAHKYGVRGGNGSINQLHDCGIVYYPDHPYLVCIMTKGHDFKSLSSAISRLSRVVFTQIQSRYPLN